MKAVFLPTTLSGVEDTAEEEALAYADVCDRLLRAPVFDILRLAGAGLAVLLLAGVGGGLISRLVSVGCAGLVLVLGGLLAGIFLVQAVRRYRQLARIDAVAKVFLRLDVLPVTSEQTMLRCAWLPLESVLSPLPVRDHLGPVLSSVVDPSALDAELRYLRGLADLATATTRVGGRELRVRLIPFSEPGARALVRLLERGIEVSTPYHRYIDYHRLRADEPQMAHEGELFDILGGLRQDLAFLMEARRHLVHQEEAVLAHLDTLRDGAASVLEQRPDAFWQAFGGVTRDCSALPLVKHLMFQSREEIRQALAPSVAGLTERFRVRCDKVRAWHERAADDVRARAEEARLRARLELDRHRAALDGRRRRLAAAQRRRTSLHGDLERMKADLVGAHARAKEAQVQLMLQPSEDRVRHFRQLEQLAAFEIRLLESRLSSSRQRWEALEEEIEALRTRLRQEEQAVDEKQRELHRLDVDHQVAQERLSDTELERLEDLEADLRVKMGAVEEPLRQMERLEQELIDAWRPLVDREAIDLQDVVDEYLATTTAIRSGQRRAVESLSRRALMGLDRLRERVWSSRQSIERLLWPREFWEVYDTVYVPGWYAVARREDRPAELTVLFSPSSPFLSTDGAGAGSGDPDLARAMPGLHGIVCRALQAQSSKLIPFGRSQSVLGGTGFSARRLVASIDRLRRQGRIELGLAVVMRFDLFRRLVELRLKEVVGSWWGRREKAPLGPLGTELPR